jgi:hypothetical protein
MGAEFVGTLTHAELRMLRSGVALCIVPRIPMRLSCFILDTHMKLLLATLKKIQIYKEFTQLIKEWMS